MHPKCRKKKDYNVMTDGKNFFDQQVKNDNVTNDNIRKIGQWDDYTTSCFLDYTYLKKKLQNYCNRFKQTTSSKCRS